MHIHPSCPWLILYPLRECSRTAHQVKPPPSTSSLRESGKARPCNHVWHYTPNKPTTFQIEGRPNHHVSPDPMESGRPRVWPEGIKCHSLTYSQVWAVLLNIESLSQGFSDKLRLTKASEPPKPAPNRCPLRSLSCLLQVFRSLARLTAVYWFSSNFSSWLAVQLLIWRYKLRSFPWRCRFQTSTGAFVCFSSSIISFLKDIITWIGLPFPSI